MPLATVCHRHRHVVPVGSKCPSCAAEGKSRRESRNVELGRNTAHWRRVRAARLRIAGGVCEVCGGDEDPEDPGSKLTVDLIGSRDHARARLEQTVAKCRRCHPSTEGQAA